MAAASGPAQRKATIQLIAGIPVEFPFEPYDCQVILGEQNPGCSAPV